MPGGARAIQDLAIGPAGTVWLATEDRGVIRLRRDAVTIFDRAAGLPTSWTLGIDVDAEGHAYVATLRHGIIRIARQGTHAILPSPSRWTFRVRAGASGIFIGTQRGATILGTDGTTREIPDLPDPRVHEIRAVGEVLYVGTEGGVLRLSPGAIERRDGARAQSFTAPPSSPPSSARRATMR